MKITYKLGLAMALVMAVSPVATAQNSDRATGGSSLLEQISQGEIPALGASSQANAGKGIGAASVIKFIQEVS